MKSQIKTSLLLIILALGFSFTANAQARKKAERDTHQWRYEIECAGIGLEGTYLIKVWSYTNRPKIAIEQAKKNAVHGIVFKGYSGGVQGCNSQKPLVRDANAEQKHAAYFSSFFANGGKYMKFVSASNDGSIGAGDRLKVNRRLYKVGVIVSIRKDELRKELEAAGVLKGLSSGF